MHLKKRFILTLATGFGTGYAPVAPGTFGTLVALPIWWLLSSQSLAIFTVVTLLISAVAVWAAQGAEDIYGSHDVQKIVIDEVAGMLITVIGVPFAWPQVLAAFILFRILDALKPPPISWFDDNVSGGFGVVIDDCVAGVIGCLILHGTRLILGHWW